MDIRLAGDGPADQVVRNLQIPEELARELTTPGGLAEFGRTPMELTLSGHSCGLYVTENITSEWNPTDRRMVTTVSLRLVEEP